MAEPENIPASLLPEQPEERHASPAADARELSNPPASTASAPLATEDQPELENPAGAFAGGRAGFTSQRRSLRRNLLLLLALALAAFVLTSWILVRLDAPFGAFLSGPQELVRAQLRALDRGELRPAYDMFSPRYRGQVSFDIWHQLCMSHWRMFHANVVRTDAPELSGPNVTLEIYLHGADDRDYRARFTLIRAEGRWWIDDVHWAEEPDERDVSRT